MALIHRDGGARLRDHRLLLIEARLDVVDIGLGGGDIGFRLLDRDRVVAVVDPGERLARLDRLIVGHQDVAQIAGDLRRDDGGVGLHVGVVGRLLKPPGGPVVPAEVARRRDRQRRGASQQQRLPADATGSPARRRSRHPGIRATRQNRVPARQAT